MEKMLAKMNAERDRMAEGLKPIPPEWGKEGDWAAAWQGRAEAAANVCAGLHDFQRMNFAVWLAYEDAGVEAVRVALKHALTQTHYFRAPASLDLYSALEYALFPIPDSIPETVPVYRGGSSDGLSWSLSKDVAEFFAKKSNDPNITERVIKRHDIAFFSNEREEQEVILWSDL